MKQVSTQNFGTFELGTQEQINVPKWIILGFQQKERQDSQKLINDTFFRNPVSSCQVNIETAKFPDSAILLNCKEDDYKQGYGQIKETFRALTKDDILQPSL